MHFRTRIFIADSTIRVSAVKSISAVVIASLLAAGAVTFGAGPAGAATGDTSQATGQYLAGTLLGSAITPIVGLAGESATSNGAAAQTNSNNLGVGVLGNQIVALTGGLQVPLSLAQVGVVGQYASAATNGSSVGASGVVSSTGAIGTGITPAPGIAPGPLALSLSGVVGSLGLPTATTGQLANLGLTVDPSSASATQAAPAAAVGNYQIAGARLTFTSPAVAGLSTAAAAQAATLQNLVNGLAGPSGTVAGVLGGLGIAGAISASVSSSNLASVVTGITGEFTSPSYPGISINLGTGLVTVDLNAITALNGRAANTSILNTTTIATIASRLSGVALAYGQQVAAGLSSAINGITLTAAITAIVPVLTINSTLGALLGGDTAGINLLGLPLGILGTLLPGLTGPTGPLGIIGATVAAIPLALQGPITTLVAPAVNTVLGLALSITVNNQSTTAGVLRETGLRASLLPATRALTVDLANASVGANTLASVVAPTITSLSPTHGSTNGGTGVTITGTRLTGSTGATFGGAPGTNYTVVNATTATVTAPANAAGATTVTVQSPNGTTGTLPYRFDPAPAISALTQNHGPLTGGTLVTITGTDLTGATGATFGTTAGTDFTVVNSTSATVITPASAAGTVAVTVQSPNGVSSSLPYTFDPAPTISGLTPNRGPASGGTFVTITGTGLTTATDVLFGATAGTALTIVNDTTATVTAPVHAAGPVSVTVVSPSGTSAALPFTFDPAPAISALTPNHGPDAGGTSVTITGTGFTGSTGVLFGTTPGGSVTVVDDTTITVVSPLHLAQTVSVTVQSPNGASNGSPYTFDPAPTLLSLTPNHGTTDGGTSVTITGTGLTRTTGVLFGSTPVAFTVIDDSTITLSTPAHAAGAVAVTIQSPDGTAAPLGYIFDPALVPSVLTSLTPNHGPVAGGTSVTITGTGLAGSTGALFGTTPGGDYVVLSDTSATVTSPVGVVGPTTVTVQSPGGASLPLAFTYDAVVVGAPVVTGLSPDHAPTLGGTLVTITGTDLLGSTGATFGLTPGTNYTVISATEATVRTPFHAQGPVSVVIQSTNASSAPQGFVFDPLVPLAPAVTGLSPNHGPVNGGSSVTITGVGFTGATGATFGTTPGGTFTVVNDTTATVIVPAHAVGAVTVTVQSPNGASNGLPYLFDAVPPVLATLNPDNGAAAGGDLIVITGTGLLGSTNALFGTTPGVGYSVTSDTRATVTSPAHAPGSVPVTVLSPSGNSAALPYLFNEPAPTIVTLSPATGTASGGTSVTITGTGFTGATGANFGTTPGTGFTVLSDTTATVTSPAGTVGTAQVTILSPNGTSAGSPYVFVAAPPVIISLDPTQGAPAGGTVVTITGSGLTGTTGATFGTATGTGFTVVNDTTVRVTSPAGSPGAVSVIVQGANGTSLALPYLYDPLAPTIVSLSPPSGTVDGGTTVTITGTGLTGATGATFGTTPGAGFTVVSDTSATVTSPANAAGSVSVRVQSPNGTSPALPYLYRDADFVPEVTALSPTLGGLAGGTLVTITGTGMSEARVAYFDGVAATDLTILSDSTATARTPASIRPVARRVALVVQMTAVLTEPMAFDYVDPAAAVVPPIVDLGRPTASVPASGSGRAAVAETEAAAIDDSLAFTGQNSAALGFFALLLMLIGTGTVLGRRALARLNGRTISSTTISINRGEQK